MPYRFLLEVPDDLYDQANVLVNSVPDAQIVDVHDSLGTGFDTPSRDMTIASQTLRIVDAVFAWHADLRRTNSAGQNAVTFALTNGTRVNVAESDPGEVIADIRRDQPWVDRSIPKIGEHATLFDPAGVVRTSNVDTLAVAEEGDPLAPRIADISILATDDVNLHPSMVVEGHTLTLLQVIDLERPERAYARVFGAALVARADKDDRGAWTTYPAQYDIEQEAQFGTEPEFAFLQNGPLNIVLQRMGRAYPLPVFANPPAPIRLLVDDPSFERIKAWVLVNSWTVLSDDQESGVFGFRDPFGYTWMIHSESSEVPANA